MTLLFLASTAPCRTADTLVAVAANFTEPAPADCRRLQGKTGHDVALSFGVTGNFYNQIMQGAPFDAFWPLMPNARNRP